MVTPPALPAAVLWDMDGTLVDTEPSWIACEMALVAEFGGTWTHEQALSLVGNELLTSGRILRDSGGVDLEPAEIVDRLLTGVVEQVRTHVPWRPGARELLLALRSAGVRCALVTMSYRSLAECIAEALPPGTFETLVVGDEVSHGKPHPEPYLLAARRLGVAPGDCVALEDSPTGIASAEAAGVPTLAIPHVVAIPAAPGRSRVASLTEVTPDDLAAIASGAVRDDLALLPAVDDD